MSVPTSLASFLIVISAAAHGSQAFDSYDAFYQSRPGAVFGEPVAHPSSVVYSYPGKPGLFAEMQATLGNKAIRIEVGQDRIAVNGNVFRFARAVSFPGEQPLDIYPGTAEVFAASSASDRPALLCVEGSGSGSGEASRHQQVFLLVDPLSRKPVFLHLPSLLSSCRAVLKTPENKLAFPNNSYLFDDAHNARAGLLVSYYTYERGRFSPTGDEIRLRFSPPEVPFQFSIEASN